MSLIDNTMRAPKDRRRDARAERIVVGDETFVRNDILAKKYDVCERTLNRGDLSGAPYRYFGGVKYRPENRYGEWILRSIIEHKKQPPNRQRGLR
jgi:hypothetical protein